MNTVCYIIAEVREQKLRQVTFEAIQAAKQLDTVETIHTILLGHKLDELAAELSQYTPDTLYVIDDAALEAYSADLYRDAILSIIGHEKSTIILGHTALGRDLAPVLSAQLHAGQISDVIAIDGASFKRPIYAGKAFEQKQFTADEHAVITIRPNNINVADALPSKGSIEMRSLSTTAQLRVIVKDVVRKASGKLDLAEAKVVVSGGRGVKSAEGFKPLEELAEVLGGAVGASRGACDAGYCDYSLQIGQTGKVVTPVLYIACGISGAIQHLAGMSQSKVIIAINKDADAPIFKVADYGIVGDLFEVVPILTEELKATIKR